MNELISKHTRNLRYKRPALQSLSYSDITDEIYNMCDYCEEIKWYVDNDQETITNALDGDEDEAYEFRMMFSDLEGKAEELNTALQEWDIRDSFDFCTVALLGNRYNCVGYDTEEEDYFSLVSYDKKLATTEAGKHLMRLTKQEMISTIGQCLGILIAFLDIRQKYDYIKATLDIIRDSNTSRLDLIRDINEAYNEAAEDNFYNCKKFDRLIEALPQNIWFD